MNVDILVERLLDERTTPQVLQVPLSNDVAAAVVERLKSEADRHWWINANRSLQLADIIIQIGAARDDPSQVALGLMARGDALKLLGRTEEAWSTLDQAGDLFRKAGDEVGWARTRIGRLPLSVGLGRVPEALSDAERAREVFVQHGEDEKRLRLDMNTAVVFDLLGDYRQALTLYHSALTAAEMLGELGQQHLGPLYTNIGFAYEALGDYRQALAFHERACVLAEGLAETRLMAIAETNIAIIAIKHGHYRRALHLLHQAHELYLAQNLLRDAAEVKRIIVECYLLLNRPAEARELAKEAIAAFREYGESYEEALTLLELAIAEAELASFDAAQAALDAAERLFASLNAASLSAMTQLRRSRIALKQGQIAAAERQATAVAAFFQANGQQVNYATAVLLRGQALLADGRLDAAAQSGATALHIAQRCSVPGLRYTSHLLLGRIAEAQAKLVRATWQYRAAAATVERVQRQLTITLRPGFLEDKGEALRALIALYLRTGQTERAFQALERAKSQVLLGYLADREQFQWTRNDGYSHTLIEELNRLRADHRWLYHLLHEQAATEPKSAGNLDQEQALAQLRASERRMRTITEQLYLRDRADAVSMRTPVLSLHDIQGTLDQDTLLIEFYNDENHLWAFTLDRHSLSIHMLPVTVTEINRLLTHLQANIAAALAVGPSGDGMRGINAFARRILHQLYTVLVAPLLGRMEGRRRLTVVPYGLLHYLPLHLLHTGTAFLTEQYEIVVLPAAGLATHKRRRQPRGALVLAHSYAGHLPHTLSEAQIVQGLFGGQAFCEQAACSTVLATQPAQILHIAAHGKHRLDLPDLSYIELADGQIFADDLLQQDLSYELVTLSACETGRAKVAAGDELIGLGRGFLYAGAGALVVSMWRVADDVTPRLMEHMYQKLAAGASKAAALRHAQRMILADNSSLHPAFWGAFQLVGDPQPLSSGSVVCRQAGGPADGSMHWTG